MGIDILGVGAFTSKDFRSLFNAYSEFAQDLSRSGGASVDEQEIENIILKKASEFIADADSIDALEEIAHQLEQRPTDFPETLYNEINNKLIAKITVVLTAETYAQLMQLGTSHHIPARLFFAFPQSDIETAVTTLLAGYGIRDAEYDFKTKVLAGLMPHAAKQALLQAMPGFNLIKMSDIDSDDPAVQARRQLLKTNYGSLRNADNSIDSDKLIIALLGLGSSSQAATALSYVYQAMDADPDLRAQFEDFRTKLEGKVD